MAMTRTVFGALVFAQLKCASGKQQDLGRIGWLRGGAQLVSGKYISDALSDMQHLLFLWDVQGCGEIKLIQRDA